MAVCQGVVSSALVLEEEGTQWLIYYTSKALLDKETRYTKMEKHALALFIAARKPRLYFQAHTIHMLTKFLLKQVLDKPEASGRMAKWAIELSEYDI